VTARKRPVFLDVSRIHLPVMAVLSLGHRISGVVMVLLIPLLVWLFGRSLASEDGYAEVLALLRSGTARVVLVLLAWVFAHHLLSGIRFLLIDLGIGVDLRHGRASAWAVLGGGVLIMFGAALALL
jgi:succinate dehydrogenase / fumarate reductase cytochrome b subunit